MVAFALAWQALTGFEIDRLALARLCQRAENEYVSVQCGLMDPYVALFGQEGKAILLDTRTTVGEAVSMPGDLALVVADSGVHHALGASAYNARRQECAEAARRLAAILPGVTSLRDVTPAQLEAVGSALPPTLRRRAQHVVHECRRVLLTVERMRQGDRPGMGSILGRDMPACATSSKPATRPSTRSLSLRTNRRRVLGRAGRAVVSAAQRSAWSTRRKRNDSRWTW